ncbi:MAG TPA: hypothetical protein VJW20_08195 [Candidatus Angelobacter sp.]|nr:hypothetical protein [Candidatus Angelobacter sp.]
MDELFGGLWHTTHPDRFKNILKTGAILPEPDIPDRECWKTSQGKDCYPYVRILGGVSLFDFDQFDPDNYTQRCPVSSWYEFVPYQSTWGRAVWIEIDREKVAREVISASDLVVRWNQNEAYRHTIMPYIEAAHLGPVSKTAFKRAFLVCKEDDLLHALDLGI